MVKVLLASRFSTTVTDVVVRGGGGLGAGVISSRMRVIGAIGRQPRVEELAGRRATSRSHLTFALLNDDDIVTVTERDINACSCSKSTSWLSTAGCLWLRTSQPAFAQVRRAVDPHVVVPILSGGNEDTVSISAVIHDRPRSNHEL